MARLCELTEIIRGVTFDKEEATDQPGNDLLPILRAGNIQETLLLGQGLLYVPQRRVSQDQRLRSGDIAICMSSGSIEIVGKTAVIESDWNGSVGAFCAIIRPRNGAAAPGYVAAWLRSSVFRQWTRRADGLNIKNIRRSELEQLEVQLPLADEQHRIVDLLGRAASIRRLRREAQETARQIVPALFNKMFGDPDQNPMGWPVRLLGAVLCESPRNGLSPSGAGTYGDSVLTLSAITRGSFDATAVKEAKFARPVAQRERVSSQDFLITRGNGNLDFVGRGQFPTDDMPHVAFPDTIIAVRPKQHELSLEYLSAFWNTAYARRYLAAKAQTTNGTFKLNQTAIVGIPVMLPPCEAQLAFAQLTAATTRSNLLQSRAETLAQAATAAIEAHMFSA